MRPAIRGPATIYGLVDVPGAPETPLQQYYLGSEFLGRRRKEQAALRKGTILRHNHLVSPDVPSVNSAHLIIVRIQVRIDCSKRYWCRLRESATIYFDAEYGRPQN